MTLNDHVLLVCGSREVPMLLTNQRTLEAFLRHLIQTRGVTRLVHGNARGADRLADRAAREVGLDVGVYAADWTRDPDEAGRIRNQRMWDAERPRLCLAFPHGKARGTRHMMGICRDNGTEVLVRRFPIGPA